MHVTWRGATKQASIISISSGMAQLSCAEKGPMQGETVVLSPVSDNRGLRRLKIHGMVTDRQIEGAGGASTFSVSFSRIDEQGRAGRFKDYLRIINGPAAAR